MSAEAIKTILAVLRDFHEKGESFDVRNFTYGDSTVSNRYDVTLGPPREEYLFEALKRAGLEYEEAKNALGALLREGTVYSPRPHRYALTEI